jgi:glycosyltransferase involved in cell wall biosynthesis
VPKISIIVPAYNDSGRIQACLDSLLNQTLRDIEIIVVDDKSHDNTLNEIREYAARDSRVRVFALAEHGGVSVARNTGIDNAAGEYLGFVDGDDTVDADFYEKLYDRAIDTGADVTVGNIREKMFDGTERLFTKRLDSMEMDKLNFNYTMWCAIYKADFIRGNGIDCPVGVITSQDTVFVAKCAVLCNKIAIVRDTFYNYIRVQSSLSSEFMSPAKIASKIRAAHLIMDFLNEQDISPADYTNTFKSMFKFIWLYLFYRTTSKASRMLLMAATIELYERHKYPEEIDREEPALVPYLQSGDAAGLYGHVLRLGNYSKTRVKLFDRIPFIRIRKYPNRTKISVFGIPILGISRQPDDFMKYNG